jgi:polysaccharide export outer membrane protein
MRVLLHDVPSRLIGRAVLLFALILAGAVLTGCAGRGGQVPYATAEFEKPDLESLQPTSGLQRIAPMDKLVVNVFQVESLSGEFQVDSAGAISFPLVGTLDAQGKTPPELAQLIATRLRARYLQSPNVQVSIKESTPQTITVDGSVRQPGVYAVKGATSLMRAVALARGTTEDADSSRVVVFRTIKGERMAAAFDLAAIRRAQADDPLIYGNDVVVVDGSRARAILRDVLGTALPLFAVFRPF